MLHQLRQTRYLALGALMLIVAAICLAAGTWQVYRLSEKHAANDRLRSNAHRSVEPVGDVLTTFPDSSAVAQGTAAQFRTVTATGSFLSTDQLLVRERTVNGTVGYLVLTPLRTTGSSPAVLFIVRGFVAADGNRTPQIAAAPSGTVSVTARVEPSEDRGDNYGQAPPGQVRAINVPAAAARIAEAGIATPVYGGYGELTDGSTGTSGLTVIPAPDLSNPAGGAVEPQHLAYIVQWYLFAFLALAAPLVMARVDSRREDEPVRPDDLSALLDDRPDPAPDERSEESERATRLAARYGTSRRL